MLYLFSNYVIGCMAFCSKKLKKPMSIYDYFWKLVVIQAIGFMLHVLCHSSCIHDKLKPMKGISPQMYNLDTRAMNSTRQKQSVQPELSNASIRGLQQAMSGKSVKGKAPKKVYRSKRTVDEDFDNSSSGNGKNIPEKSSLNRSDGLSPSGRRLNKVVGTKKNLKSKASDSKKSVRLGSKPDGFADMFGPIRIKPYFEDDFLSFQKSSKLFTRLNESLQRAVKKIKSILSVFPVSGPLMLNRTPERICSSFWSTHPTSGRVIPRRLSGEARPHLPPLMARPCLLPVSTNSVSSKRADWLCLGRHSLADVVTAATSITDANSTTARYCCLFSHYHLNARTRCAIPNSSYKGETCIDNFKIPEDHLRGYPIYGNNTSIPTHWLHNNGRGIPDADIVIYVHSKNTVRCKQNGLIAYAAYCHLDQFNRPVAGFINYCPAYLEDSQYNGDVAYLTSLHEFFHVLGFSKHLFDKYQNCELTNTTPARWVCERRKNAVGFIDGRKYIVTPAVRRETSNHLQCDSIQGCPLENHNLPSVATASHWEGRFMQGSLMAPTLGLPHLTAIDRITLAAFEDMGWYKVNFSNSEELFWGKGAGCEFADQTVCLNESQYFCKEQNTNGCHFLHLDKGICETDRYLDNCKVFKAHRSMECWREKEEDAKNELYGETFSENSRCFLSNMIQNATTELVSEVAKLEGRCYEHRCNDSQTLEVRMKGSKWKVCPEKSNVTFSAYEGVILCPPAAIVCGLASNRSFEAPSKSFAGTTSCGNFTITVSDSSVLGEMQKTPEDPEDSFSAKLSDALVSLTAICGDCVSRVKRTSDSVAEFVLSRKYSLQQRQSGTARASSDAGSSNRSSEDSRSKKSLCVEAVRRLLVAVADGSLRFTVNGKEYIAKRIDFDSEIEDVRRLQTEFASPTEVEPSNTGMYTAAAIGTVCGAVLVMIGAVVYWKSSINVTVSPVPATPITTDVRYQPNSGSMTVAPSESGSSGQLPASGLG